ncbi:hypothetical protein N0B31_19325 [Salinirubellus salinus]|uniref:Uncharacterized protein n=1 Tax=Salinirubellus salinus TaxID=1364945 RepID=A0A9E7R208_9EURY|nr:DUF6541 family protein [Salinirubellus salinus]UWM54254.1 hypothetical protein N0B31_19325 [Salinirubellus salinus]
MDVTGDRRVKVLAAVSLWLLVAAVLTLLFVGPAPGYEISLYEALPTAFWVFVVGAILVAQAGLLARAFDPEARTGAWVVLLAVLLLTIVTLLVLPYVRGYPVYGRADVLSHVGFVRSIDIFGTASNREFYPTNIYPNIHMLVLAFAYATGVDPMHVINGITPFVTFTSIAGLYLLLAEVSGDRRQAIAATAILAVPIGTTAHVNTSPYAQSLLLVPLVLYLFFYGQRTGSIGPRIALVVALVSLVLYHPLTAFFVLFVFGAYAVTGSLGFAADARSPALAGYVTVSAFATWYLQFAGIVFKFRDTVNRLLGVGGGPSTLDSYTSTVESSQPALLDLLRVAALRYVIPLVVVGLTGLYVLYLLVGELRGRRGFTRAGLTLVAGTVLFTGLSALLFVFSLPLDYSRPLLFGVYLGLVPAGIVVGHLWHGADWTDRLGRDDRQGWGRRGRPQPPESDWLRPTVGRVVVVVAVVSLTFVTVFALFYSPLASLENHQVTQQELEGTGWVFEHRDPDLAISTLGVGMERHHHAQFGVWTDLPVGAFEDPGIPAHFNYTERPTFGASLEADRYFVVSELGRISYPEKFPDYRSQWRYTPEDFARLEHDPTVAHVYDNGELDTYRVTGTLDADADADADLAPPTGAARLDRAAPDTIAE